MNYFFFYVELALKDIEDSHVYAFVNMSHIPTKKLIEIFEINLESDPHISEGYFLTKENHDKHRDYLKQNIGSINLDIFTYTLRLYSCEGFQEIRKMYKEKLME